VKIIKDKIEQTAGIMNELDIDLWLVFVRETIMQSDPVLPMVVGFDVTWQSSFFYTRNGDAVALVGGFDRENFERSGCFSEVHAYSKSVRDDFVKLVKRFNPRNIALNYSADNPASDGLTHGMYILITNYLKDTPFAERLISSNELCSKLRCRKLPVEIERLSKAAQLADEAWQEVAGMIEAGMTEIDIANLIDQTIVEKFNAEVSFKTIVNAGDKTKPGHSLPSDARLEHGDLLHIDFGVKFENFCSDIQRLLYVKHRGDTDAPEVLKDAFALVKEIIDGSAKMCRPGVMGFEIDSFARKMLVDNGYPEYSHALGHQLGRDVHDGGAIIGPKWPNYGVTPTIPLEKNNVFTLELEINLPGIGCVGLEEDVLVTENGAKFLSPRQTELIIK